MSARLGIVIPTQGRETLQRAMESCWSQMAPQDELIIVVDRYEMPTFHQRFTHPQTMVLNYDAGHHCWGHCQLNYGLSIARADYILCQDDDDIYAPGAFDRIRSAIDALKQPRPLLFRFQSWFGPIFWDEPGVARESHIGGHSAVFPNDERLGRFTCRYAGDFDYIRSTLDNWGGDHRAVWVDDVIAIARPSVVRREEVLA